MLREFEKQMADIQSDIDQESEMTRQCESKDFSFDDFALNGKGSEMEKKMLADQYILGRMAILGQSTAFYSKPNAGKTLIILSLIINGIKNSAISGKDIYYINADDNHRGLVFKLRLAEKYGFKMLSPGYNNFESVQFSLYLDKMIKLGVSNGKILILDTVKKFTDLMNKSKASAFGEIIRQFVSHGGSVVMLAHVNKHRGEDGRVVFAGTADLVDDADCAYTLDILSEEAKTGLRTVKFENIKNRGDVAKEEVYCYSVGDGLSYYEKLESVKLIPPDERRELETQAQRAAKYRKNKHAIEAILECIKEGVIQKTALIAEASDRCGISKPKIAKILEDHAGTNISKNEFWNVKIGGKNSRIFEVNYSAFTQN